MWAARRKAATALGLAVRAALLGHSGAAGGLEIQSVFLLAEGWDFDAETGAYRTGQDYEMSAS
ncbi:MAG: hypothetical protein HUU06_00280 [Planctomycetaceae bacterium]|nr:hypothetical protein [Planctomycetota bacterium]NUN51212.1 hypothetical protein [Planctomycetaceae bacterium]